MQNKIVKPAPLLNDFGDLQNPGYSTSMVQIYDRNKIKTSKFRIKEWDYYLIYNNNYGVALTISNNSYMNLMSASIINFNDKSEITKPVIKFFPGLNPKFPNSSKNGDIIYKTKKLDFQFLNNGNERNLIVNYKNFNNNNDLHINIVLTHEPKESMVIATPFNKPKHFYYNQKIIGFLASGNVTLGDLKIDFNNSNSFGLLDWGRGVWTYKNTWYWSAAMGKIGKDMFGFNLGYGFGNTESATENMLFYNGIAHKLNDVTFNIPKTSANKFDYLSPWKFTSSDNKLELDFTPIINRKDNTNAIIISSDQNQVFGKFNGYAILEDGKKIQIKDLLGFAERVVNKW